MLSLRNTEKTSVLAIQADLQIEINPYDFIFINSTVNIVSKKREGTVKFSW